MIDNKPWVAFFSRSGKEIADIADATGRAPDVIVTNANGKDIVAQIFALSSRLVHVSSRPTVDQYRAAIDAVSGTPVITLHGWLRIVPPEICEEYTIYNGHPALITEYPELKGLDMQEAVVGKQELYPNIGSVIHKVTPVLDDGQVIVEVQTPNTTTSVSDAYTVLRKTSLLSWENFFSLKATAKPSARRLILSSQKVSKETT